MENQAEQYKGFIIKKGVDCEGSVAYFAYQNGAQQFDAEDSLQDLKERIDLSTGE